MILRLTIENYALIDKTEVEFKEGFTVITGETGAGKSIMLDALSLLMGARADTKAMGDKTKKTIVEAAFTDIDEQVKEICRANDIETDDSELILRREISTTGKSRAFINDTPVNLSVMQMVASKLVDIHSQHKNILLSDSHYQTAILDEFGNNQALVADYREAFHKYVDLRAKIKKAKELLTASRENREFILFRLEQLDKLKPRSGELVRLEKEFEILSDADRIKTDLEEAYGSLAGHSVSAGKLINEAANSLGNVDLSLFQKDDCDDLPERLDNIKIELRDISDTIRSLIERITSDPEKSEKINARIQSLYEAMKRFKVKDEEGLIELHVKLKEEIKSIDGGDSDLTEREKELKLLAQQLKKKAELLSEAREKAALEFSETLVETVRPLGMPNIRFEVEMEKGKLTSEGQDIIKFRSSFNKNHAIQEVSEIASGGEVSRLMLGIKSIMSGKVNLPTIVFDEIDTGVSGEIAHKMGSMMKDMSANMQVIAISHLPQVVSAGASHFKVYKTDEGEKTVSRLRELRGEERVKEIASMLSGTEINEAAINNARILLKPHCTKNANAGEVDDNNRNV